MDCEFLQGLNGLKQLTLNCFFGKCVTFGKMILNNSYTLRFFQTLNWYMQVVFHILDNNGAPAKITDMRILEIKT